MNTEEKTYISEIDSFLVAQALPSEVELEFTKLLDDEEAEQVEEEINEE